MHSKLILFVLLLTVMVGQITRAEARLYQSDSNPFIRMMMTMMDTMGMVDKVPNNAMYGQYGSPWSGNSNPYMRSMALRGIYPGSSSSLYNNAYPNNLYGNSPFMRSPWLQSPWLGADQYGSAYTSPIWGSPDWGVLPTHKYIPYGDPYYGKSYWSDDVLEGWVDEPWEASKWNPDASTSDATMQGHASPPDQRQDQRQVQQSVPAQQQQPPQTSVPLVQNFNFVAPENLRPTPGQPSSQSSHSYDSSRDSGYSDGQGNRPGNRVNSRSPLLKLLPSPSQQSAQQSGRPPAASSRNQSPLSKKTMQYPGRPQQGQPPGQASRQQQANQQQARQQQARQNTREKACITEFCGLKKPNMNGLWVAQNGEMLGIKGNKFLWADSSERFLAGYLKVENEYLVASVEGSDRLMRFKYKLAGDHLLTMQPDGVIREFVRTTPGEIYGGYYGGY